MKELYRLDQEDITFWVGLLKKYLIDGPSVTIRGIPSLAEQHRMTAEEKDRVEKQRTTLGVNGLNEKEKILNGAIEQNEVS